jgi:hypothetical protein
VAEQPGNLAMCVMHPRFPAAAESLSLRRSDTFIAEEAIPIASSEGAADLFISLLKELEIDIVRVYKHCAPNGAIEVRLK